MFEPADNPRLFGTPPGVDFPAALVEELTRRAAGHPPEALARVHLVVNTRRMARRIRELFDAGPALLLPRITLVTDLSALAGVSDVPAAIPPLRRRLELIQLIAALLDREPDIAPRAALFDLADSLVALMDEMQGEDVPPSRIERLDTGNMSEHWARIKAFLGIIRDYFDSSATRPGTEARQRLMVEMLIRRWRENPPPDPVIVAGSTGSRGATRLLMQAVARLPRGAVVVPGFDFDMPADVWRAMDDPLLFEDHPQYRFRKLCAELDMEPTQVERWGMAAPASPARNKVLSLALRPAPVTDQWLEDGPDLPDLATAMQAVTLLEAPNARHEALAIAMRLRQAAEDGQTAALITPDRVLTRQVTAALDRWDITPDDSAGTPLHLSPPGRFLRHVGDLGHRRLTAESLLTLLKHPLTHSGTARGPHLLLTRELELHLRRNGPPFPTAGTLTGWAATRDDDMAIEWARWAAECFTGHDNPGIAPLPVHISAHLALAERIAQGCQGEGSGALWEEGPGREAQEAVDELRAESPHCGQIATGDYVSLFQRILADREVRNPDTPHPNVLIWGTLEARVQGADLLILAGLNEGRWPEPPAPDPWLNRALRQQAGLLSPERRIGLSAHDFQQAAAAPEVWLSRSLRSDDSETVASRWVNRLQNLLTGLPAQSGPDVLGEMRSRGQYWLRLAGALEDPGATAPAPRPAPCPPRAHRPHRLSVTEIKHLIRDPYTIYARHILGLRPLDPLMKAPDALLRGIVIHEVLEAFVRLTKDDPDQCTSDILMAKAESILAELVPWAEARALWLARLDRVADWFVERELGRRILADPVAFEALGSARLPALDFTLSAKADRIDIDRSGDLHIYDYKTGSPPTRDQQTYFDKQLLLEAAIAQRSGFGDIAPAPVARAVYIGLGGSPKEVSAPLDDEPVDKVWAEFESLIAEYLNPRTGYTARRALQSKTDRSDYDQLARFGEWDITDPPVKEELP